MADSDYEKAKIIREMIRHEDDLFNQRITWFSTIQGLLFAALALSWDKTNAFSLVIILSLLGAIISGSTYYTLRRGLEAVVTQMDWWDKHKPDDYSGPDIIGRRPTPKSKNLLWPYFLFPIVFMAAWIIILIWRFISH